MNSNRAYFLTYIFLFLLFVFKISGKLDSFISYCLTKKEDKIESQYIPPQEQSNDKNSPNPTSINSTDYTQQAQADYTYFIKAYDEKNYENAIYYGEKVLLIDPNNINFLETLTYCYSKINNYEKSIQYCKKILSIDPNNNYAKKQLAYASENIQDENLSNGINSVVVGAKAPSKMYALIKTNLSADIRKEVEGIIDLVYSDINGKIMLNTIYEKNIPININESGPRAQVNVTELNGVSTVENIDIPVKEIHTLNNTNLSPFLRISSFMTFMHEFGHAYTRIKDPYISNSMEEELGISMIGYNIAYVIVQKRYLTDEEVKMYSMLILQAMLSDDHKELPVYSGFNKKMESYCIQMPAPQLYSDIPGMYKKLLSEGKTTHVESLDKLVK